MVHYLSTNKYLSHESSILVAVSSVPVQSLEFLVALNFSLQCLPSIVLLLKGVLRRNLRILGQGYWLIFTSWPFQSIFQEN